MNIFTNDEKADILKLFSSRNTKIVDKLGIEALFFRNIDDGKGQMHKDVVNILNI